MARSVHKSLWGLHEQCADCITTNCGGIRPASVTSITRGARERHVRIFTRWARATHQALICCLGPARSTRSVIGDISGPPDGRASVSWPKPGSRIAPFSPNSMTSEKRRTSTEVGLPRPHVGFLEPLPAGSSSPECRRPEHRGGGVTSPLRVAHLPMVLEQHPMGTGPVAFPSVTRPSRAHRVDVAMTSEHRPSRVEVRSAGGPW
jgi:hypothetical protein